MAGFATFEPKPAALSSPATAIGVFRLAGNQYQFLPNIVCLSIERKIGAQPGQAKFRYIFNTYGDPDWPETPEDVLEPGASGMYIVNPDDRLVVFALAGDGEKEILFDGFCQLPSQRFNHRTDAVEIVAMGTPVRCWDQPCWGRYDRHADDPTADINSLTDLPIVFNPDGLACMTDIGNDGTLPTFPGQVVVTTPMFLDPLVCKSRNIGRQASLAMAVHYILANYNDQNYVNNGVLSSKDIILDAIKPLDEEDVGPYDPNDPSTYTSSPIIIKEYDATGIAWPVALEHLLGMYGFNMVFNLSVDDNDMPTWIVQVFRIMDDDPFSYQQIFLQPTGSNLDPAQTNVLAMHLSRDRAHVLNEYAVESRLARFEASFVLAPFFIPLSTDALPANIDNFRLPDAVALDSGGDDTRDLDSYRTYVFDETGDGHYDDVTFDWITGVGTSLVSILGGPKGNDESAYVKRRRPGRHDLFTLDEGGKPRPSLLLLSIDYEGPRPGVWDGTGTWYEVGVTWRLLDDRLGITLTAENVEAWNCGNKSLAFGVNIKSAGGIIKGVSAQALLAETHFVLMLTTVIDGDTTLEAVAGKRVASPTAFSIREYVDAKERYRLDTIIQDSWWNYPTVAQPAPIVVRDDTMDALFEATQRRAANEMPPLVGSVTLGRFSTAYELEDRITTVEGRNLDLVTNATSDDEPPLYPMVVGIMWDFDGKQTTTLELSDQRYYHVSR